MVCYIKISIHNGQLVMRRWDVGRHKENCIVKPYVNSNFYVIHVRMFTSSVVCFHFAIKHTSRATWKRSDQLNISLYDWRHDIKTWMKSTFHRSNKLLIAILILFFFNRVAWKCLKRAETCNNLKQYLIHRKGNECCSRMLPDIESFDCVKMCV